MKNKIVVREESLKGHTRREFLKLLELAGFSVVVGGTGFLSACSVNKNQLANAKEIITRCGFCGEDCGMKAYVKDNIILAVAPWKEDPIGKGFLCDMGLATPAFVHAPDRILNPLKKHDGKFVETSWDEALSTIAEKLSEYRLDPGPESVVFHYGVSQVRAGFYRSFMRRFCNVYGSPNYTGCGSQCAVSKMIAKKYSIGSISHDYENTRYIIQWGCNPATSSMSEWINEILPAKERGAKLVCIDPRPGAMTRVADLHLRPIPGTDGALALAMANIIIEEGLYKKDLIENYGLGFDEFRKMASEYSLQKTEAITSIPAESIKNLAIEYATSSPSCIATGNGLELHLNGVQTIRAIMLLQALTGNVDVKGGVLMPDEKAPLTDMELKGEYRSDKSGITSDSFPILWKQRKMISVNKLPEALLTGKPYPIKALMVIGGNPLLTGPNASHQKEAFKRLDFMVVMDLFMTETAKMADIVLPGATFMESDNFKARGNRIYMTPRVIPTVGQGWPTWKLWFELAKKMGYTKEFPWNSLDEAIDEHLKPVGNTAAELKANFNGIERPVNREYDKYEKNGFKTPTGKIEFSSPELQNAGYNPLPDYVNPYENGTNRALKPEYPYIMMSGGRIQYFYHSQHRNIPELLRKSPEPVIEICPADARDKGISEGDLVMIYSPRGSITAKALFVENLRNGIVGMTHGWNKSNINELTDDELLDPISGFPAYRGFFCNIEKV